MTDKYAVIGNPIAHSKSPLIHQMFARQTEEDISYEAVLAPLDGFAATVERLREDGYKGCNVTVPFKFEALKLARFWSHDTQRIQSVNTLVFESDVIRGENTDGLGLVNDITKNLAFAITGKRVLLMGAGGASYGVAQPLLKSGAQVSIANRTLSKAQQLASAFTMPGTAHGTMHSSSYADLAGQQFDLVINATSSSLKDEMPPLPTGIFAPGALAYDMMYGKDTPFMRFAREQDAARVCDGLGMLVEQAAEAFLIWRGVRPDTAPVLAQLRAQKAGG